MSDFKINNRRDWIRRLQLLFPSGIPQQAAWNSFEVKDVLSRVCGKNVNHMFFPNGGGLDLHSIRDSYEDDCLELETDFSPCIVKPYKLTFESFSFSPGDSYFRLEASRIPDSGIYPKSLQQQHEELLETTPLRYHDRACLETEFLGYDEDGYEIPIPEGTRVISRYFGGIFVIFAKGSVYNALSSTYDGRHNRMNAAQFRQEVESILSQNQVWVKQHNEIS